MEHSVKLMNWQKNEKRIHVGKTDKQDTVQVIVGEAGNHTQRDRKSRYLQNERVMSD